MRQCRHHSPHPSLIGLSVWSLLATGRTGRIGPFHAGSSQGPSGDEWTSDLDFEEHLAVGFPVRLPDRHSLGGRPVSLPLLHRSAVPGSHPRNWIALGAVHRREQASPHAPFASSTRRAWLSMKASSKQAWRAVRRTMRRKGSDTWQATTSPRPYRPFRRAQLDFNLARLNSRPSLGALRSGPRPTDASAGSASACCWEWC